MKKPIEINTNILSEWNFIKLLSERKRYNNDGIIKYGFVGVFCFKKKHLKKILRKNINELTEITRYDRIFIINKKTKIEFLKIEPRTLLFINCDIFKKAGKIEIPVDLIGMCCCSCTRELSIVLLMNNYIPEIFHVACFIWKEECVKIPDGIYHTVAKTL